VWPVKLDRAQLGQVIMNLTVNARDAMPGGGTLTIATSNTVLDEAYARRHLGVAPGEHVQLTISDNGVGMDRSTQERIFEPFFTPKGPGRGTGMGLATVRGIVQQSGGHIRVESGLGDGASFIIHLPRTQEVPQRRAPAAPIAADRGSETILLVEDDVQVRAFA